jgi:hypothetical protein
MKQINLMAREFGTSLTAAGFTRITARRYLRVTPGDIAQRIELRPNCHGGEVTCDLTIHPLFAREHLSLDVLEPGIWIRTLCSRFGQTTPTWYEWNDSGIQKMVDAIASAGIPWFNANATAEGIIQSAAEFAEPWRNEQFVHVDLGHCYLRVGRFAEALQLFNRKPSRVPRYQTLSTWIATGDIFQIEDLHSTWTASSIADLPIKVAEPCGEREPPVTRDLKS